VGGGGGRRRRIRTRTQELKDKMTKILQTSNKKNKILWTSSEIKTESHKKLSNMKSNRKMPMRKIKLKTGTRSSERHHAL
jgi:hypothetical protein